GMVCWGGGPRPFALPHPRWGGGEAPPAIPVESAPLAAVSDCREAIEPHAPHSHSDLATNIAAFVPMSYGDVDIAFASAAHVFEEEIFQHRGAAMTLEGRAVLANHDPAADLITVWSATQT